MENLNAEQIIKALECCQKRKCQSCTYDVFGNPLSNCRVKKHALALIKSQEQRIAELEAECKKWQGHIEIECEYTKAYTVRKMQGMLKALIKSDYINGTREQAMSAIDQIAKEIIQER